MFALFWIVTKEDLVGELVPAVAIGAIVAALVLGIMANVRQDRRTSR